MHLALLMGSWCDRGLRFTFAESVPEATQNVIRTAIFTPWPGTRGKMISGRFTGTLEPDPEETRFFRYYFRVASVADLKIEIGQRPW